MAGLFGDNTLSFADSKSSPAAPSSLGLVTLGSSSDVLTTEELDAALFELETPEEDGGDFAAKT